MLFMTFLILSFSQKKLHNSLMITRELLLSNQ